MAGTKVPVLPEAGSAKGWVLDVAGPTPALGSFRAQRAAIARACQELVRLGGDELEISGRKGLMREARMLGAKQNRRYKG